MTRINALCSTAALVVAAAASAADVAALKCESWHPRLGQNPDVSFAIDFAAKTCDRQPCAISDAAFKWQGLNGRSDVVMDRTTGEGTVTYLGELLFTYKNCSLPGGKP
jgi:hypothetical protein